MQTFTVKNAIKEVIFTDLLMIGFNAVWFVAIFAHIFSMIPADLTNIAWSIHTIFGFISISWFLGLRTRTTHSPSELVDPYNVRNTYESFDSATPTVENRHINHGSAWYKAHND